MQRAELQITRYCSGSSVPPSRGVAKRGSVRSVDYTNNIRRGTKRDKEKEREGKRDESCWGKGKETFIREGAREKDIDAARCGSREYQTRSLQSPLLIFITNNPLC